MIPGAWIVILGFGLACAISAASLPLWRSRCRRWGHVDDPGHRKIHVQPVPLAGGFAVLTGWWVAGSLAWGVGQFVEAWKLDWGALTGARHGGLRCLGVVISGAVGMMALGAWDDRRDLGAGAKFLVQAIIASAVAAWGVRMPVPESMAFADGILTVLWILSVTNAFNLSDNMNGLCAGLGLIGAVWVGVSSLFGQGPMALACLAAVTAGSLAGYLPFNYPRASVFLGDAGSQWVGYVLSVLAILMATRVQASAGGSRAWISAAAVVAIPLIDTAFVVLTRTLRGQPFWVGDTHHLSHRLARAGLGKPGAVAVLWSLGALLGLCLLF